MTTEATPAADTPQPGMPITVGAQYIKDFSFESPNAPQIFAPSQAQPQIEMGVNLQTRGVSPNTYEVLLMLKLDTRVEGKTAFIAELTYGGLFTLPVMPEDQLKMFLLVECPRILFPFARSIMMSAIRDGGFPFVMINPVDFMALYLANKDNIGTMPAAGAA